MKKRKLKIYILAMSMILLISPTAMATLIDYFDVNQSLSTSTVENLSSEDVSGANIIGGYRDLYFNVTTNPISQLAKLEVNNNVPDWLFLDTGAGVLMNYSVEWDGLSNAGLGGIDIQSAGEDSFRINALSFDQYHTVQIEVTETAGAGGSTATFNQTGGFSDGENIFLFSEFANIGNTDFSSVDKIVFSVSSSASSPDSGVQFFETYVSNPIPEPATMVLFGSGLLGVAFIGRKKLAIDK